MVLELNIILIALYCFTSSVNEMSSKTASELTLEADQPQRGENSVNSKPRQSNFAMVLKWPESSSEYGSMLPGIISEIWEHGNNLS